MSNRLVILVAFREFDNLGVGYLASVLSLEGFDILIIDFREGKENILNIIKKQKPLVVGFSVIFQFYIYEFKELITHLRKSGITSHFSAGGQYASMKYKDLFDLIPWLDSVVRFEGEYTFLELVRSIYSGTSWQEINGLVFKENGRIHTNPLRTPEIDLDKFPFPIRMPPEDYLFGKRFATIIAGRGCVHNCSFCNNTEYLKHSSLPVKRLRKPEKVVEEIDFLYHTRQCSIFLFEDDDFPVGAKNGSEWINNFCKVLRDKKLIGKIIWKINCRPDEIEYNRFALMKKHGLYLVFLGIDDGTDYGLKLLNKNMTIAESIRGINILKELEIGIDYGFMLFQPASTLRSVNQNLEFLRELCSDSLTPVTFLKLWPFFDTRIEKELHHAGRLKGKPGLYDYDFLSNSLNQYYKFIETSFMEWINDPEGLSNIIKWARNYFLVFSHFYRTTSEVEFLLSKVKITVAKSNKFILDTMEEISDLFETGKYDDGNFENLKGFKNVIERKHKLYKGQIGKLVKRLSLIGEYQMLRQLIRF